MLPRTVLTDNLRHLDDIFNHLKHCKFESLFTATPQLAVLAGESGTSAWSMILQDAVLAGESGTSTSSSNKCDVALRHKNLRNCSLGCFVCKVLTLPQKTVRTGTDLCSQHFKSWIPPQGTEFFTLKLFAGSAKLSKALASNSILAIAVARASNRA